MRGDGKTVWRGEEAREVGALLKRLYLLPRASRPARLFWWQMFYRTKFLDVVRQVTLHTSLGIVALFVCRFL